MKVKLGRDCRHSMPEPCSAWNLRCMNPEVNRRDPWALAATDPRGSCARDEREKKWFAPCGMKGKLWEPKPTEDDIL